MPNNIFGINFLNSVYVLLAFKIGYIIAATIYFIFSLIVIRQVNLMSETVITESVGILKIISFIHALIALGVLVAFVILL